MMRMLHTMLRVGNLERSLAFYTEVLGMTLLRKRDYEEGRFTLAFVGYGDEENHTVLELTHNWDTPSYELGNAYGHIAIAVNLCIGIFQQLDNVSAVILKEEVIHDFLVSL